MRIKEEPVSPDLIKKPRGRVKGSKNKKLAEPFAIPGLEPHITTREAAAYLRRSPITLEIWRTDGFGPKYFKVGGRVFYHKCDLQNYEQGRRSTSEVAV